MLRLIVFYLLCFLRVDITFDVERPAISTMTKTHKIPGATLEASKDKHESQPVITSPSDTAAEAEFELLKP